MDEKDKIVVGIFWKYVDRLSDPVPEDPLERSVGEMLKEFNEKVMARQEG